MAPLRTTSRSSSPADSTAGSTTIATGQIEKSTGQCNKYASPSWLKLFKRIPREGAVRKVSGDAVQMPHPLRTLEKMVDHRRNRLISRCGGILNSFKKPRIGLHRTWPEADDKGPEDIVDLNPPREQEERESRSVGSRITDPVVLKGEPNMFGDGGGAGSNINNPIIIEDEDDDYSDDDDEYSEDEEGYSDDDEEYSEELSDLADVEDSDECDRPEDGAVDQGSDSDSDIFRRPGPFFTAYRYIPKT